VKAEGDMKGKKNFVVKALNTQTVRWGVIRLLQQKYSQGFAEVTAKSLEGYVEGQESLQQVQ
jgi:hypothetical protein